MKPIPKFKNEAEEREFWESHDSTQFLDWSKATKASFPNLKPSTTPISIRLPNGLYLFQVKENTVVPFEDVRNDIYNILSDGKFKTWFDEVRGKIAVSIDDEAAIKAELAYH